MKRKALTLACVMGMSAMLFSGCGLLDNNGGVTTRNADRGNTVRNLTDNRNNTMDFNRDGMRGRVTGYGGMRGTAGTYGMTGTGISGMTGRLDMDSQLRSMGFQNTLVIGNTIIVASEGQQGQTGGTNGTAGTTGMRGTTGTAGTTNMRGTAGMRGTTGLGGTTGTGGTTAMGDLNRYFGRNTHVLKVTDKQAIKAIQRVKSKLNSDDSLDQASTIAADIKTILKHATPMDNNNNNNINNQ